ncbi:Uncharacterised protein [Yersinia pekkanenii]|uniref:Lipoprotein n=1 Tax=Yersinia pekkanenii TaxID=1288385 RepID=A0A0T9RAV7_9GAMM|nr:Uncharacterised protein [Yersinia pekkanenii]CRY69295.1 Uncharacterised protein [Yersinia pekkanenii]
MRNVIRCCFVIAALTITSPAFAFVCQNQPDSNAEQCAEMCALVGVGGVMGYLLCY